MGRKKNTLTIIDKSKPKPSKYVYQPKPIFKNEKEEVEYWELQKERWINGYAGLTGAHYFYLQECYIKSGTGGDYIRPIWRDADDYMFQAVQRCLDQNKALFVVKRREIGATSVFGGCLPNYFMRVFPGATMLLTSKEQSGIFKMFEDKTMVIHDNLDSPIRPLIINKNQTKSSVYLKVQYKVKLDNGEVQLRSSDLFAKETSETTKSVNAFSGTRAKYLYIDEAPLHKRLPELLRSVDACLKEGTKQTGLMVLAGTVEESLTNEDLDRLQGLIANSELLNAETLFLPAWLGLNEFMVNGWSDKKKGIEWVEKEIERLDKLDDKSFVRAFKRNYPLNLEDIFEFSKGSRYEDDVSDKIALQLKKITSNPPTTTPVKLVETSKDIESIPDKKGVITILEYPKPGVEYILVSDGIATGTDAGNLEGSNAASLIIKGFDPDGKSYCPVAWYSERPKTVEISYINLVNLIKFYNKYGMFKLQGIGAEANAGTGSHLSTYLIKLGLEKYIQKRKDLTKKGNSNTTKYFQYVTIDVREWQMRQANIFLRKHVENIECIPLLKEMLTSKDKNTDLQDAWLMQFIVWPTNFDEPVKKINTIRFKEVRVLTTDSNGRTSYEWKKIPIM